MKNRLNPLAILIPCTIMASTVIACTDKASTNANESVIEQTALDSATVLVVDSTDYRFDSLPDAPTMLVYNDSILIATNRYTEYGEFIISLYDIKNRLNHLADYILRGSDTDEMVACGIKVIGDELFVNDSYYTRRYCTIDLKALPKADELHLLQSGIEETGVAIIPFHDGLLVENPQCYSNESAGIHNDVPRLLYYENGQCLTPQEDVTFRVADVNTGASLHGSATHQRVCFVSHGQPIVEFYNDSLQLVKRLIFPTDYTPEIYIHAPKVTMRQRRNHNDDGAGIRAKFDNTQRVVGAGPSLHAFLCSAADEEHIYLVYCGKMFGFDFHTYPTEIIVLDWDGNITDTYQFNRWIAAISPSSTTGEFYLTVYADDSHESARTKLIKVIPQQSIDTDI